MSTKIPAAISELEDFCLSQALVCTRRLGPIKKQFGDVELEYSDSRVSIEIRKDRGIWTFGVAGATHRDDVWYDGELIQSLLFNRASDGMSVTDQVAFVKSNWVAIVERLSAERLDTTMRRLQQLAHERMERWFFPTNGGRAERIN
jgi:hypothetical protein